MESNTIKEFLPEFYAHNLEPYTNYRLKVHLLILQALDYEYSWILTSKLEMRWCHKLEQNR